MLSRNGNKHLNDAIKSKIITLKLYSTLTNAEIAEECECCVSNRLFHSFSSQIISLVIFIIFLNVVYK